MIEPTDKLAGMLDALRDSSIAGGLSWLYDGAWRAWIGEPVRAAATHGSLPEAVEWLRAKAIELCPDSDFAKVYRRGFE